MSGPEDAGCQKYTTQEVQAIRRTHVGRARCEISDVECCAKTHTCGVVSPALRLAHWISQFIVSVIPETALVDAGNHGREGR